MIYVDPLQHYPQCRLPYKYWCHMATDGQLSELHQMAAKLGLRRAWFQDTPTHPHYDLTPAKCAQAIRLGAQMVSAEDLVQHCYPQTLGKGLSPRKIKTQEGNISMRNKPSTDHLMKQLIDQMQTMTDQEVTERYAQELLKLKILNEFGRHSERFLGYPNTSVMNRCRRELERRGLPIPPVNPPAETTGQREPGGQESHS